MTDYLRHDKLVQLLARQDTRTSACKITATSSLPAVSREEQGVDQHVGAGLSPSAAAVLSVLEATSLHSAFLDAQQVTLRLSTSVCLLSLARLR